MLARSVPKKALVGPPLSSLFPPAHDHRVGQTHNNTPPEAPPMGIGHSREAKAGVNGRNIEKKGEGGGRRRGKGGSEHDLLLPASPLSQTYLCRVSAGSSKGRWQSSSHLIECEPVELKGVGMVNCLVGSNRILAPAVC